MKVHLRVLRYLKPRRLHRSASHAFNCAAPVLVFVLMIAAFGLIFGWSPDSVRHGVSKLYHSVIGVDSKPHRKPREPLVMLKRELSAVILKAANDVRWGRTAVAVAKLESAAAMLDPRYSNMLDLDPIVVGSWPTFLPNSAGDGHSATNGESKEWERTHADSSVAHKGVKTLVTKDSSSNTAEELKDRINGKPFSFQKYPISHSLSPKDSKPQSKDSRDPKEDPKELRRNDTQEADAQSWWSELTHQSAGTIDENNIPTLVTALIDGCNIPSNVNRQVVDNIREMWPLLRIRIALSRNQDPKYSMNLRGLPNVTVHFLECRGSGGQIAPLVSVVSTPFVLYLESASAVTKDLSLKIMLETVRDTKGVALIGMSERGSDGAWDYVCTQLHIKNSRLMMQQGYYFSRNGCLFCDVTSNSFLSATWILQEEELDCSLPEPSRKLDWSLRFQRQGILLMTCPNSMTHINKHIKDSDTVTSLDRPCVTKSQRIQARDEHMSLKRQYRKIARKWELTSVVLPNNTRLEYSCLEIHYNCQAVTRVKYYALPDCCLKIKNKMFATLDAVARKEKIPFEVHSGSLLGAVKFKNAIPWDFDDDAIYRNSDMKKFLKHKQKMRQVGLSPVFKKEYSGNNKSSLHNYFSMSGQGGFSMDLWGVDQFKSLTDYNGLKDLPPNLVCFLSDRSLVSIKTILSEHASQGSSNAKVIENISAGTTESNIKSETDSSSQHTSSEKPFPPHCFLQSLVRIGSNWLPGPWNPAEAARKHYGPGLYHHEPHWRMKESKSGWANCPRTGHHGCLDLHPMDGTLPFL